MFCPECGSKIPDGADACPACIAGTYSAPPEFILPDKPVSLFSFKDGNFGWLAAAIFFLSASFVFKSLLLSLLRRPVPEFFTPVSTVICWILASAALIIYFRKASGSGFGFRKIGSAMAGVAFSIIISLSAMSLFAIVISVFHKSITTLAMDSSPAGLLIATGYFLLVLIMQFIFITALMQLYMTFRFSLAPSAYAGSFMRTLGLSIRNLLKVSVINLVSAALLLALLFLNKPISGLFEAFRLNGFLSVFSQTLLYSALLAVPVQLVFNLASALADKNSDKFTSPIKASAQSSLILAVVALIPALYLAFAAYAPPSQPFERIVAEIKAHETNAEIMADLGYTTGAIKEYDTALSKAYSLRGMLNYLKSAASSNSQLSSQSSADLLQAEKLDIYNGYVSLFRGNILIINGNPSAALGEFRRGLKNGLFLPESFIGMLRSAAALKDSDEIRKSTDWLIKNGVYNDGYAGLYGLSLKKTDSCLEKLEEVIAGLEPKQALKYYDMVRYNDHAAALNGLIALKEKYPADPGIRYYITLVYAEYRSEQRHYSYLVDEATSFHKLMAEDLDPDSRTQLDEFKAQMLMQADQYEKAGEIYAQLYKANRNDAEIAGTYVYLLVRNSKHQEAVETVDSLGTRDISTLRLSYLKAVALLNLGLYAESLEAADEMVSFGDRYTEEYDRLLYAYSLAYANAIKNQEHVDLVSSVLKNKVLEYYILGMKGWKDKNSEVSNGYMLEVEAADPRLGYALYAIGVNYYEQAIRTGTNDFDRSIEYYLRSLEIIPEHFEGYFALGHCYKKAEMKPEALRAFRRVLELVPYTDHRTDPYGIVPHAAGEVSSLSAELSKEGY